MQVHKHRKGTATYFVQVINASVQYSSESQLCFKCISRVERSATSETMSTTLPEDVRLLQSTVLYAVFRVVKLRNLVVESPKIILSVKQKQKKV